MADPTRYAVGDKVVIAEACVKRMWDSNRWCKTPNQPPDDFVAKAKACMGTIGEVTRTFPPGYEVTACFGGRCFHMKDTWIEKMPEHQPRRPLDDDEPDGYLESDLDYMANNHELAVILLNAYAAK